MKKKIITLMVLLLLCGWGLPAHAAGTAAAPQVGEHFPELRIPLPESKEHRDYLGLQRGASFVISQLKADIVIVEVLSMYCPFCQAEAPAVNDLFSLIENDSKLKGRVKIIGIAAGNTSLERDMFVGKYKVPFPVFADGDFVFHKALGEVRTPYFFAMRVDGGKAVVFYSNLGAFDDPASFLALILARSEEAGVSR